MAVVNSWQELEPLLEEHEWEIIQEIYTHPEYLTKNSSAPMPRLAHRLIIEDFSWENMEQQFDRRERDEYGNSFFQTIYRRLKAAHEGLPNRYALP